jgi:hypothetical protein
VGAAERREPPDFLDPGLAPGEREELGRLARRLEGERPVPRPAFRGGLRRRLLAQLGQAPSRPRRLRLLVTAYTASGLALLAFAAIGLVGAGPFAA